jgi:predicted component of type VI protein secretion system
MNANLVLLKMNGAYKAFALPKDVTVIGRRHDCDLRIPLPTVSRRHCQLSLNNDTVELRDLGSTGGTFVNDSRVDGEVSVKAGDYIRVGPLTFLCQIDGKPEKITPPRKAAPPAKQPPKPQKAVANVANDDNLDDDLADLDASDSFIDLDELDADLEDLKDV